VSNWTTITQDNLEAAGHSAIVDAAQSAGVGGVDPVAEAIADAVSRVRAACSTGNAMDSNPAKVPNSLKGLTIRIALFGLMERIGYPLTEDQRDTRRNDNSYLLRINDDKLRFENPDTAGGDAEMQGGSGEIDVVTETRREPWTRKGMEGLL
jgi:hypothetical protein